MSTRYCEMCTDKKLYLQHSTTRFIERTKKSRRYLFRVSDMSFLRAIEKKKEKETNETTSTLPLHEGEEKQSKGKRVYFFFISN